VRFQICQQRARLPDLIAFAHTPIHATQAAVHVPFRDSSIRKRNCDVDSTFPGPS
jgi:hypothetical protein